MKTPQRYREEAKRCRELLDRRVEPELRVQLRLWAVELEDIADATERGAEESARRNLLGHCRIVRPGSATASTLCARWLSIAVDAKPAADVVRKPDTMLPVPIGWCRLWPELLTPRRVLGSISSCNREVARAIRLRRLSVLLASLRIARRSSSACGQHAVWPVSFFSRVSNCESCTRAFVGRVLVPSSRMNGYFHVAASRGKSAGRRRWEFQFRQSTCSTYFTWPDHYGAADGPSE